MVGKAPPYKIMRADRCCLFYAGGNGYFNEEEKMSAMLTKEELEKAFKEVKRMRNQANSRILSWEHCIVQFSSVFGDINNGKIEKISCEHIDYLSLHLGFFLASWGMMRGSTDLLGYDYKVHIPAIKTILHYTNLFRLDFLDNPSESGWESLENLTTELKVAYTSDKMQKRPLSNMTDTLVTKILMGTLGIVPAYDDFVKTAVKHYGITTANFNRKSFEKFAEYFSTHFVQEINAYTNEMQSYCQFYTKAKVIDVLLWYLGKEISKQKAEEKRKTRGEK